MTVSFPAVIFARISSGQASPIGMSAILVRFLGQAGRSVSWRMVQSVVKSSSFDLPA